jgi:hypothetical protein
VRGFDQLTRDMSCLVQWQERGGGGGKRGGHLSRGRRLSGDEAPGDGDVVVRRGAGRTGSVPMETGADVREKKIAATD